MDLSAGIHKPMIGPAAHHTSTARDPRLPEVSPGGDGIGEPDATSRTWVIPVAMVLVIALAIGGWALLGSRGDDAARAAAAADGIVILPAHSDEVTVTEAGDGYRILRETVASDGATAAVAYFILPAEAAPSGDAWTAFEWPGVEAYVQRGADAQLFVEAGAQDWSVLRDPTLGNASARAVAGAWGDLVDIVAFDAGA
ncbi:hypothetical protein [Demequina mangrovi]|uniref:Uncharacterized protein n=1 Tax=Demequina mangrovi TaxID=1043493 RepID=A0A1H6XN83_9MICO|nr:hypothetical protein [Demequina mangrovi]SEJ26300.1 hypothetical protein SAMN05421637_1370 [Demequina mangrovi]